MTANAGELLDWIFLDIDIDWEGFAGGIYSLIWVKKEQKQKK